MANRLWVLNRDYVLATKFGHCIGFTKGVPISVPRSIESLAAGIGATLYEGEEANFIHDPAPSKVPEDPAEKIALIDEAIKELVARNITTDFTATGVPSVSAVSRELGFRVFSQDITPRWQAYHDAKAAQ